MDSSRSTPSQHSSHHPRRAPAHQSISLRHVHPASCPSTVPTRDQANAPSTISPKLTAHKQSSGESSDAGHWYESRNNNAVQSSASFVDSKCGLDHAYQKPFPNKQSEDDPPFFLRNSPSSGTPLEGHEHRSTYMFPQPTIMPNRPGMGRRDTEGSRAQDFRSVIDDLTIANKKLKQKLRKYEKLYDAHLQDEKLFEVRFHGLPDDKKKELEEQLRKFAADLDGSPDAGYTPIAYPPPLLPHKSTHSQMSRVAESGYASMSASGKNSTSAAPGQENERRRMSTTQYNQQQQSIRSYLHDIPAGLLPKRSAPMTEKSKKKLVVRRLEQIFAGKRSVPGSHPHPMQQEEVAQLAAMADRQAKEATGQRTKLEGLREARIMPLESEEDENAMFATVEVLPRHTLHSVNDHELAGSGSPDQRPTRPLDLDPYRAQVPTENIQYIRHLGFTPPDIITGEAPEEGHGWLYLNLLINMAQLHTINVTPDFVKDAVSEFSSKFELSKDGRKIRWRGGQDVDMGSNDSSPSPFGSSSDGVVPTSPPKRPGIGDRMASSESIYQLEQQTRRIARALKKEEQGKFAYTPLFFHQDDSDDEDDYYNLDQSSSNNSAFPAQPHGDSPAFADLGMQNSFEQKRRHDDGPIIFYNRAKFCTDLSGDRRGFSASISADYKDTTSQPLGTTIKHAPSTQRITNISEPRGPLANSPTDAETKEGERTSSSESELGFSPEALRNDTSSEEREIMNFEASGLGGVHPDDNFSIKVRRSQTQTAPSWSARAQRHKANRYPKGILDALREQPLLEGEQPRNQPNVIRTELVSAHRKFLPSSTLPPPSYMPFGSPSSCPDDSNDDSDVSSGPSSSESDDEEQPDPTTQLQLLNIAAPARVGPMYAVNAGNEHTSPSPPLESSSNESSSDEDDDDDSDDGSVDFLATARKLDPKSVLASEREYDAAVAERLAEEIPTGSSAATAGGGSGFVTPIGPIGMDVIKEDVKSLDNEMTDEGMDSSMVDGSNVDVAGSNVSASTRAGLKRSRTSESIVKLLKVQRK
jgi:hypothetical protein